MARYFHRRKIFQITRQILGTPTPTFIDGVAGVAASRGMCGCDAGSAFVIKKKKNRKRVD